MRLGWEADDAWRVVTDEFTATAARNANIDHQQYIHHLGL